MPPEMLAQMVDGFWDMPMVAQVAFHPRQADAADETDAIKDGKIQVAEGVSIGYRLYKRPALEDGSPPMVLVFHHGNAEMSTDFEDHPALAQLHGMGCALLVVDYRGFGWSDGTPSLKSLSADADKVAEALPGLLEENGLAGAPMVLWGRSIGATNTVQLASAHGAMFKGVVIESGLMDIKGLPMVQQMSMFLPGGPGLLAQLPDPLGSLDKLPSVTLPALVIHGDQDEIVPVTQGQKCHELLKSEDKILKIFEGAGHNDVQSSHGAAYLEAFSAFIAKCKA